MLSIATDIHFHPMASTFVVTGDQRIDKQAGSVMLGVSQVPLADGDKEDSTAKRKIHEWRSATQMEACRAAKKAKSDEKKLLASSILCALLVSW